MWRKTFIALLVGMVFLSASPGWNQGLQSFDPVTQKALRDIQKQIRNGQLEGIEDQINRVINSSGYIKPLAQIYYRLAQNESNGVRIITFYQKIIENWPNSAWAQKALVEATPLILMSGGTLGQNIVPLIWRNEPSLLNLADDAKEVGEDAQSLRNDVAVHFLYLANSHGDVGRLQALANMVESNPSMDGKLEWAKALAFIHTGQRQLATQVLQDWVDAHPDSDYLPSAYLTIYMTSEEQAVKQQVRQKLLEQFTKSVEVYQLQQIRP